MGNNATVKIKGESSIENCKFSDRVIVFLTFEQQDISGNNLYWTPLVIDFPKVDSTNRSVCDNLAFMLAYTLAVQDVKDAEQFFYMNLQQHIKTNKSASDLLSAAEENKQDFDFQQLLQNLNVITNLSASQRLENEEKSSYYELEAKINLPPVLVGTILNSLLRFSSEKNTGSEDYKRMKKLMQYVKIQKDPTKTYYKFQKYVNIKDFEPIIKLDESTKKSFVRSLVEKFPSLKISKLQAASGIAVGAATIGAGVAYAKLNAENKRNKALLKDIQSTLTLDMQPDEILKTLKEKFDIRSPTDVSFDEEQS